MAFEKVPSTKEKLLIAILEKLNQIDKEYWFELV